MSHITDIQAGDKFRFLGLTGTPEKDDRTLVVLGISTSGDLSYRIDMDEPLWGDYRNDRTVTSIPYDRALLLIAQGIWQMVK